MPREQGRCSCWTRTGSPALGIGTQLDIGRVRACWGGTRGLWLGASVCGPAEPAGGNHTNPWRLVGIRTGSLLSQCYIHQLSLQLHCDIEPLGDAECPNAYIQISVNPLSR